MALFRRELGQQDLLGKEMKKEVFVISDTETKVLERFNYLIQYERIEPVEFLLTQFSKEDQEKFRIFKVTIDVSAIIK